MSSAPRPSRSVDPPGRPTGRRPGGRGRRPCTLRRRRRASGSCPRRRPDRGRTRPRRCRGSAASRRRVVRLVAGERRHPFTEPWSRAAMNWRWKTGTRRASGSRMRIVPGAQQRDVGRVVALERAERAGHRALRGVLDEDEREQELVPGPDGHEDRRATRSAAGRAGRGSARTGPRCPRRRRGPPRRARPACSRSGRASRTRRTACTAPISGRTIANRVLRMPSSRAR